MTLPLTTSLLRRIRPTVRNAYRRYLRQFIILFLKVQQRLVVNNNGINLIGYFSSNFGIAEVGRFFAQEAIQANFFFSIINIDSETHTSLSVKEINQYLPYFRHWPNFHKNIFFINAGEIVKYHTRKPELFTGRYNAAVLFWEFDDYFDFPEAFSLLDEAIAFTDFVATAICKSAPKGFKVTKLSFPFIQNWQLIYSPTEIRNRYAIGADDVIFFFNFDFRSIYERKNPTAILRAMDMAFNSNDQVLLIIKTLHSDQMPDTFIQFQTAINRMKLKGKVLLINESLQRNDMMSIINASDAYISLHRSEGLGLGMMEAMSMAKPVIGTAYGGNLDFMNTENALLVDYKLVPLAHDELPYKKGWLWAEADLQMAAGYMRKLYDDRSFGKMIGRKAQGYIEDNYNSRIFTKEMKAWLQAT